MAKRLNGVEVELKQDFPILTIERVKDSNPSAGIRIEFTQYWAGKANTIWFSVKDKERIIKALQSI